MNCLACGQDNREGAIYCDRCGAKLSIAIPGESGPAIHSLSTRGFVGRHLESGQLQESFRDAWQERGSINFIAGEAGIGKTRLAREARKYALERGFLWFEGSYPQGGGIPYQPWVEAIRQFLTSGPEGFTRQVFSSCGAQLVRLVPEIGNLIASSSSPSVSPEEERYRLLEALDALFTGISREQPLVLFLDDLQWATSLDALHHVGRKVANQRIVLLGAYRETELEENPTLLRNLLAMNRERLFRKLSLGRLNPGAVRAMVEEGLGSPGSRVLNDVVYEKTEGNPFFVEEMLRYLNETRAITLQQGFWELQENALLELPRSVKAVVGERLEHLGEAERSVLAWASVAGPKFGMPLLSRVTGWPEDRLLEVVDTAVQNHLLSPRQSPGMEVYAFTDEVIREVLYEGIGPARRRRYHLRVAEALEQEPEYRLEEHYQTLAHHFLEAGDLAKALEYSLKAGDRAFQLSSWERSSRHFETALELLEELPQDLPRRAQVLERLAELDQLLVRPGLRYSQAALETYLLLDDRRKAARLHRIIASAWGYGSAGDRDIRQALVHHEAAVKLLNEEPDSPEKAYAYSGLAHGLWRSLDLERSLQRGREALAIAERVEDADQITHACTELGVALALKGELAEAREQAERSWRSALEGRDIWLKGRAGYYPIGPWCLWRDRDWSRRWLQRSLEHQEVTGSERYGHQLPSLNAFLSILAGMPEGSREALPRIGEMTSLYPYKNHSEHMITAYVAAAAYGEEEKAVPVFDFLLGTAARAEDHAGYVSACVLYGDILLVIGDNQRAADILTRGYGLAYEKGSVLQELNLLPLLCELEVKAGRPQEAQQYLTRAQEILARPQQWRGLAAAVDLVEGMLATATKHWPQAEQAFERALEGERSYGFLYWEGRILVRWAEMRLARGAPGDHGVALEMLEQALDIFKRCTVQRDIQRAEALLEAAWSRTSSQQAYPDGLSGREVEVLHLLARGRSNREIAAHLVISPNTVANHVANILSKTGSVNRSEAAAYAIRHGLADS